MIYSRVLTRSLRHLTFNQTPSFGFAAQRQNYYNILGVDSLATQEQIKEAYRKLALKYHPDVSTELTNDYEPSAKKFQEIAEAYAVLSVEEQRRSYDFLQLPNRNSQRYTVEQALEDELSRRRSRDGQVVREPYKKGSFAEERQKILAEERAKFNVDSLGRYKGGLPIRGKGVLREGLHGQALGAPGHAHDALIHQMKTDNDRMDYQNITPEVAQNFANHQNQDRWVYERRKSSFIASVDYEYFKFAHWQTAWVWIRNIFLLTFGLSFIIKGSEKAGASTFLDFYRESIANQQQAAPVLNGYTLVQRPNGLLVAVEARKKQSHHH